MEKALSDRGHEVFSDRKQAAGIDWAKSLLHQIETSDLVVPLLSSASVDNEMFAFEVELAYEAARQKTHQLRLIPVRIGFDGPLPQLLGGILNTLEALVWRGPEDDQLVIDQLTKEFKGPAVPLTLRPRSDLLRVSSTDPSLSTKCVTEKSDERSDLESAPGLPSATSELYTIRSADSQFQSAIKRGDSIVLIKGARQMGKTSLLARALHQATRAGARVVLTDLQQLNTQHLESADNLYLSLCELLSNDLNLEVSPQKSWDSHRGPNANFERFFRREVLAGIQGRLVWGIDSIDRLFSSPFATEVFSLFRSWHNERALDPTSPWGQLVLAISYATEAHLFIRDLNQSPFNVGTRLRLDDFSREQVTDLNDRFGAPLKSSAEIARFFRLMNGQPYLTSEGLRQLSQKNTDIEELERLADRDEGIFGDHLRRLLTTLAKAPELCEAISEVLAEKQCLTSDSFYRLRSAGILVGRSEQDARLRCQIYATYLARHLL